MEEIQQTTPAPVMSEVPANPIIAANGHQSGGYPHMADFLERFAAFIIDGFIIFAVSFPLQLGLGIMMGLSSSLSHSSQATFNSSWGLGSFMGIILQFAYFGWFDVNKGQTLGKMVMKIKVVRSEDLKYVTWGQAFLREIVGRIVSGLAFYLGYLWFFMSPKRQGWHDTIGSTYVVKTDSLGNILMDGPAEYKKEPMKTFGCCAIFGILFILVIAGIMFVAAAAFKEARNSIPTRNYDSTIQQKYNYDDGSGMPSNDMPSSEDEMQKYFDEMNKQLNDQMNQNDDSGTTPAPLTNPGTTRPAPQSL